MSASVPDPRSSPPARPLPSGYRQGIISSITVVIGFSLLFVRYWAFEAEGEWSAASILSAILLLVAIALEFVALWRALLPSDDDESVYRITLRVFFSSVLVLAAAIFLSGLISAHVLK